MRSLTRLCLPLLAVLALPTASAAAKGGDRDHDRLPDRWERSHHTRTPASDADDDGLDAFGEWRSGTDPHRADSDRDGTDDAAEDRDGDGLGNGDERTLRTDPRRRDSDRDGRSDAREDADHDGLGNLDELRTGNDPLDPDSDDDGLADGRENAGRIVSADDGVLVLALATGGRLTASFDAQTEVGCGEREDAGDDEFGDDDAESYDADDDASAAGQDDDEELAVAAASSGDCLEAGAYVTEAAVSQDDGRTWLDAIEVVVSDEDEDS